MLNLLFAADFPIEKTGIVSTAASILAEKVLGPAELYCDQPLLINGTRAKPITDLGNATADIVFTHTEYSALPELRSRYPNAVFHVGDWPIRHWASVQRVQPVKGALAVLRCKWRLRRIDRKTTLVFVAKEDCASAIAYGFSRALHIPLGVKPPDAPLADTVDVQTICFSGNFRYPPNRDAAKRLLDLAESQFPHLRLALVGFYADDFKGRVGDNVEIYADVPSVVNFLASRRPIYVSLIDTGAGAKNKILEAMVAGCPIICTPESLDSSIASVPTVKVVTGDEDVVLQLRLWSSATGASTLAQDSARLSDDVREYRSWWSVAQMTRDLVAHCQG